MIASIHALTGIFSSPQPSEEQKRQGWKLVRQIVLSSYVSKGCQFSKTYKNCDLTIKPKVCTDYGFQKLPLATVILGPRDNFPRWPVAGEIGSITHTISLTKREHFGISMKSGRILQP